MEPKKLSLETILKDSIWVVKMNWGRLSGTYEEMKPYIEMDEEDSYCRDHDLCCEQPEHLKDFYDGYWKYDEEHGFTTIQDYYEKVYAVNKKVWSKAEIKELLMTNDKAVARGLVALYNCQTDNEQFGECTTESNGVGFNKFDAELMTNMAKWYIAKGFLTSKQIAIVRKKIVKYAGQLTAIANA